jgi:hypothetical protein
MAKSVKDVLAHLPETEPEEEKVHFGSEKTAHDDNIPDLDLDLGPSKQELAKEEAKNKADEEEEARLNAYGEHQNAKIAEEHKSEKSEVEHEEIEARKKLSRKKFAQIHPIIQELDKTQLVQCILVVASTLADKALHPHHASELHGIIKHHKLGRTGYEELIDEDGNKIVQKESTQIMHGRDVRKLH